jgi:hypothetical protein
MESSTTADKSTELHSWVVSTQACLERTKPGEDGLLRPEKIRRLNVCVSKESIQRAMLIWDRILKAVEASKLKIRMENEAPCRTIVTVDGEELSVSLKEKSARSEHKPTPAEKREMERSRHFHGVPKWDYTPTGILILSIDHEKRNEHKWTDGKKRIEDRLSSLAEVMMDVAKDIKERRARAEEWHRNWVEEVRRRQEAARLQAEENRRIEQLERQASVWRSACSLRGFIDAVREEARRRSGAIEPGSPVDQWVLWAERHAASIDPVATVVANLTPTRTPPGEQHHEDGSAASSDHVG